MTDPKQTPELLPCPFCGVVPVAVDATRVEGRWNLIHRCEVVGAISAHRCDRETLARAWNRRADLAPAIDVEAVCKDVWQQIYEQEEALLHTAPDEAADRVTETVRRILREHWERGRDEPVQLSEWEQQQERIAELERKVLVRDGTISQLGKEVDTWSADYDHAVKELRECRRERDENAKARDHWKEKCEERTRQRDEARAERDLLDVYNRAACWVRLTDEDIERAAQAWASGRVRPGNIKKFMRDLRDGKLGGADG